MATFLLIPAHPIKLGSATRALQAKAEMLPFGLTSSIDPAPLKTTVTMGLLQSCWVRDFQNTKGSLPCQAKLALECRVESIALCVRRRAARADLYSSGKTFCLLWWCAQELQASLVAFNHLFYLSGKRVRADRCFIGRSQGEGCAPNNQ